MLLCTIFANTYYGSMMRKFVSIIRKSHFLIAKKSTTIMFVNSRIYNLSVHYRVHIYTFICGPRCNSVNLKSAVYQYRPCAYCHYYVRKLRCTFRRLKNEKKNTVPRHSFSDRIVFKYLSTCFSSSVIIHERVSYVFYSSSSSSFFLQFCAY